MYLHRFFFFILYSAQILYRIMHYCRQHNPYITNRSPYLYRTQTRMFKIKYIHLAYLGCTEERKMKKKNIAYCHEYIFLKGMYITISSFAALEFFSVSFTVA